MTAANLLRTLAALVLASLSTGAFAQSRVDAVPVYDSTEIAFDRYTVIRRLGVEGSGSAFRVPGHRDLASARAALVNEAASIGADGVINLHCLSQTDALFNPSGYFCHGNAIRVRNERRVTG